MRIRPFLAPALIMFTLATLLTQTVSAATYRFLGECESGCTGLVTARVSLQNGYTNTIR